MEHNNLTSIACARPVIYAEGLFVSCYLCQGKFMPEEGLNQQDLWSILNGEFLKAGSDLVEDFALKNKLKKLATEKSDTYELEDFMAQNSRRTSKEKNLNDNERVNHDVCNVHISLSSNQIQFFGLEDSLKSSEKEAEMRKTFEKQVHWIMGEGEEFVTMECFTHYTDALILLDVLKRYNVPSVVSFLARRDEPIAVTFSKIKIDLDCLMFCLFQA